MSHRKNKKESKKILQEILSKYEFQNNDADRAQLAEMKILLYEFVQIMNYKQIKETLKDYHIHL
jgi:hypothetical protein